MSHGHLLGCPKLYPMVTEAYPCRASGLVQIAITLSEGRSTATTVAKQLAFCEDRSEDRRAKHANDCHCRGLCICLTFALGSLLSGKLLKQRNLYAGNRGDLRPVSRLFVPRALPGTTVRLQYPLAQT